MNINKDSSFMNEVEINLNRLGALLLNQVGWHVDSTYVVIIDQSILARQSVKLEEELPQPGSRLYTYIGYNTILSLYTRT